MKENSGYNYVTAVFHGSEIISMDSKNRFSFPAVFRKLVLMEGSNLLYLYADIKPVSTLFSCLRLYTQKSWTAFWNEVEHEIQTRTQTTEQFLRNKSQFAIHTASIELDRQGRITVPSRLTAQLGYKAGKYSLMGYGNHIRMFPKEVEEKIVEDMKLRGDTYVLSDEKNRKLA